MKRSILIFLILFTVVSSGSSKPHNSEGIRGIIEAASQTGFDYREGNISGWVKTHTPLDSEGLKEAAGQILKSLDGECVEVNTNINTNSEEIHIYGRIAEGVMNISGKNVFNSTDKNYNTFLTVEITHDGNVWNILKIGDALYQCLKEFGVKPEITYNMTYFTPGRMNQKKAQGIIDDMFSQINANKVDGIINDNLISICGYTNDIENYKMLGDKKININAACRYSSYDDGMYFIAATPIINIEY